MRGNTLPGRHVDHQRRTSLRFTAATNANQPQLNRPAAWCRDVQQGRSFYTELGGASASWSDARVRKLALGAIQWASGMVRGGCKAGINSNYTATQDHAAEPGRLRTRTTWAR